MATLRRLFVIGLGLLAALAMPQAEVPEVLVVQQLVPSEDGVNPNIDLQEAMAVQLEEQGRVFPIAWSMADAQFRRYVQAEQEGVFIDNPTVQQVRQAAEYLRPRYVMYLTAYREEGEMWVQARLELGGRWRTLWTYEPQNRERPVEVKEMDEDGNVTTTRATLRELQQLSTVQVDGVIDWRSTADSLARFFTFQLAAGPFGQHPAMPRMKTPEPAPGPGFNETMVLADPDPFEEDSPVLDEVDRLVDTEQMARAIVTLRAAIDREPFDPSLRRKLVELYLEQGLVEQAAREAALTVQLQPEATDLRLIAARAWFEASEFEQARTQLNEALARGADGVDVWLLRGDLELWDGEDEDAIEHYNQAVEQGGGDAALMRRAMAYAVLGDPDACRADIEALGGGEAVELEFYRRAVRLVERSLLGLGEEIRDLPARRRNEGGGLEITQEAMKAAHRADALAALMNNISPPAVHEESHSARRLALNLLAQAGYETLSFVETGDDNSRMEAALSLGEALRLLPRVRETYSVERRRGA
jgi:tetratricopeptide (TPR) repeat protein